MNKTALTLAASLLAAAIALASPYPGGIPAGGLTSQDYISIADEAAQQPSGGGRPLLGAVAPSSPQLGFIAISVTGLTATKTVGGEDTLCKEVILYYWFNWDATGYHPYIIFSQSLYGTYTQWEVQDAAENIGATTIDDEYYPYAWRSRLWIPAAYETGYFKIYVPEEYDGDMPGTGNEYMVMTNGVKYVRKGSLPRSAMVVAEFNPAAFTVFQRKTELATSTPKASRLLLSSAGPVAQETTDYTFDDPVRFNAPTYYQSWDDVRVGTNTLSNALQSFTETDPNVPSWAKVETPPYLTEHQSLTNYYTKTQTESFMALEWTPGAFVGTNKLVFHDHVLYKCVSAHSSAVFNPSYFTVACIQDVLDLKASSNSPYFTGQPTAPDIGADTRSQVATKNYVDTAVPTAVSTFANNAGYAQIITNPANIPASGHAFLITENESYLTNTTEQVSGGVTNIVTTITTSSYPVLAMYSDGNRVWTSDPAEQGAGYYIALAVALMAAAGGFIWRFFAKTTNILKVDPETGAIYYETED